MGNNKKYFVISNSRNEEWIMTYLNFNYDDYIANKALDRYEYDDRTYRVCMCGCDQLFYIDELTFVCDVKTDEEYRYFKKNGLEDEMEISKDCLKRFKI